MQAAYVLTTPLTGLGAPQGLAGWGSGVFVAETPKTSSGWDPETLYGRMRKIKHVKSTSYTATTFLLSVSGRGLCAVAMFPRGTSKQGFGSHNVNGRLEMQGLLRSSSARAWTCDRAFSARKDGLKFPSGNH